MSTMRKTKGSGVMPAVMTFWNADESFNQKETERYIQWVLDCGAHSLSVTGSTGENRKYPRAGKNFFEKSKI